MVRHAWPTLFLAAALLGGAARGQASESTSPDSALPPGVETILVQDLRAHVEFLADDRLQGRAAGTPGNVRAGSYVAACFEQAGLEKVARGGRSWFQPFRAESRRYKAVDARNIAGIVRGTDDVLAREFVIVGAHYDHVGVGNFGSREPDRDELRDRIHNGADDNASGTAGVLELAEAFAKHPAKRSILFLAFSAEELGLLGSYHFCEEPLVPLADTVAMVNLDMIGRSEDDYLFVGGVGTSPVWPDLIERHLAAAGLRVERGDGGRAPSDNTPFYERGVPVLFFFTNVHLDYHRVSDEARFINYGGEEKILRAVCGLIRETADAPDRPEFRRADGTGMPASMGELMSEPSRARDLAGMARGRARERVDRAGCGRLGFAPATGARGELMIGELLAEGPAASAGLEVGDVILAVGDRDVRWSRDVARALEELDAGASVALRVRRAGRVEVVEVRVAE
jgi:hypothetical protein